MTADDKRTTYRRCMKCSTKREASDFEDGDFITCPACGHSYRVRFTRELSDAIDDHADGRITAEQLMQASFDQDFTDMMQRAGHQP